MNIVQDVDSGLTIHFSREDLIDMPREDFHLLGLFVKTLTEEYGNDMTPEEKKQAIEATLGIEGVKKWPA